MTKRANHPDLAQVTEPEPVSENLAEPRLQDSDENGSVNDAANRSMDPDMHRNTDAAIDAARGQVDVILRARQISTVIYVDDGNPAAGQYDSDPERVIAALEAGLLTIEVLAASDTTSHIVLDDSGDPTTAKALADRLRLRPETVNDQDLAALTDALRFQVGS